jgi:hypothetical protein
MTTIKPGQITGQLSRRCTTKCYDSLLGGASYVDADIRGPAQHTKRYKAYTFQIPHLRFQRPNNSSSRIDIEQATTNTTPHLRDGMQHLHNGIQNRQLSNTRYSSVHPCRRRTNTGSVFRRGELTPGRGTCVEKSQYVRSISFPSPRS